MNLIAQIEAEQIASLGKTIPDFKAGDTVRVGYKVTEGTRSRVQAYEGVAIPGYPNFFTVFGPYGYNGSSYFALIEAQVHHIVRCLREARHRNATRVEVTHP